MADVQRHVARFTNDSRIPGWDRAADLTKGPAVSGSYSAPAQTYSAPAQSAPAPVQTAAS